MEVVASESADLVLISNKCLLGGWKGDCHQSKIFCFCECLLHRISVSKGKAIVLILFVDQQVAMTRDHGSHCLIKQNLREEGVEKHPEAGREVAWTGLPFPDSCSAGGGARLCTLAGKMRFVCILNSKALLPALKRQLAAS